MLFWSGPERSAAFRMMDRLPFLITARRIVAGPAASPLPEGPALELGPETDLEAFLSSQSMAALIILHDGRIRLERYGEGFSDTGRWTSFSVAKSVTSTLVGAAIRDGFIGSLDDRVTLYLPELSGSAYEDVTIAQLLTMTSGVAWNEDYEDPQSDVARFDKHVPENGMGAATSYMRLLERAHPPGEVWNYSTGETNLIGVLVSAATGRNLSEYLSEKIWTPYGMEQHASWLLGRDGHEISGCCIQASTRDFARFGQFVLDGGYVQGEPLLADDWFASAGTRQADIGEQGFGYGFQWWTRDDGSFMADGIFGQGIFIDPSRRLVIATNANWTSATGLRGGEWHARDAFYTAVQRAIDREIAR